MTIQALGYLGIGTDRLDDWTDYATNWLGMQAVNRGAGVPRSAWTTASSGWSSTARLPKASAISAGRWLMRAALDALGAHLEKAGVAVTREPKSLADQRFVRDLISFADPSATGWRHSTAPRSPMSRLGRVARSPGSAPGLWVWATRVLMVTNVDTALAFYRDLLGFRISDFVRGPVTGYFMHVNPRHHSLALFEAPFNGMHHLMVELYSFDDVGQGYDIALATRRRSSPRSGATRTIWSPHSTCTPRRTSLSNTAGVASKWMMRHGSRMR